MLLVFTGLNCPQWVWPCFLAMLNHPQSTSLVFSSENFKFSDKSLLEVWMAAVGINGLFLKGNFPQRPPAPRHPVISSYCSTLWTTLSLSFLPVDLLLAAFLYSLDLCTDLPVNFFQNLGLSSLLTSSCHLPFLRIIITWLCFRSSTRETDPYILSSLTSLSLQLSQKPEPPFGIFCLWFLYWHTAVWASTTLVCPQRPSKMRGWSRCLRGR